MRDLGTYRTPSDNTNIVGRMINGGMKIVGRMINGGMINGGMKKVLQGHGGMIGYSGMKANGVGIGIRDDHHDSSCCKL